MTFLQRAWQAVLDIATVLSVTANPFPPYRRDPEDDWRKVEGDLIGTCRKILKRRDADPKLKTLAQKILELQLRRQATWIN